MLCADDVLLSCTLENGMVLGTNVTPINSTLKINKVVKASKMDETTLLKKDFVLYSKGNGDSLKAFKRNIPSKVL